MKNKLIAIIFTLAFGFAALLNPVSAQLSQGSAGRNNDTNVSICTFIGPLCTAIGFRPGEEAESTTAWNFISPRLNLMLAVLFIGIILIAVYVIVRAGITYIQSQGEDGKIAEARKSIQNVFIGIAILFVGVIGVVLVLAFFGGLGLLQTGLPEGCDIDPTTGNLICTTT